jgi:uncharacterized protein YjiS (DUF1127 family)
MRRPIDTEGWARHAGGANGFGEIAGMPHLLTAMSEREAVAAVVAVAHAERTRQMGDMLLRALAATARLARRALVRYRQYRDARRMYHALRQLDDRALHDLGLDRSELTSIAHEVAGRAEATRAHLYTTYGLPG